MENTVVWADIPVADLDRAMKFYGAVLQHEFVKVEGMDGIALLAPEGEPGAMPEGPFPVSLDLAQTSETKPGYEGTTIYLNSFGEPEAMLERAAAAGGKILHPVKDMGQMVGFIGFFEDTEGNRIGVHKPPQM